MCESNKDPNREYAHDPQVLSVQIMVIWSSQLTEFFGRYLRFLPHGEAATRRHFGLPPIFGIPTSDNSLKSRFRLSLFLFLPSTKLELAPQNKRSVTEFSATTKKGSVRVVAEKPTW